MYFPDQFARQCVDLTDAGVGLAIVATHGTTAPHGVITQRAG